MWSVRGKKTRTILVYIISGGWFKHQEHVISERQHNRDRAISTVNVH